MPLSLQERESVLARVEQRSVGRNVSRYIARAAVGRACKMFSTSVERVEEPAGGGENFATLCVASMPDLASQVRLMVTTKLTPSETACGRAGRLGAIVMRPAAGHEPELRGAAAIVGCNAWVGPVTARGGEEGE